MRTKKKGKKVKGSAIFYENSRMRAVITGLDRSSDNVKTGRMGQTFMLKKSKAPTRKVKGAGCEGCPVWKGCYLFWEQAPMAVHRTAEADRYAFMGAEEDEKLAQIPLRVGSAGEPTSVPDKVWKRLLALAPNWTGYTHKWRLPKFQNFKEFCMASVHSVEEAREAQSMGWRTFRAGGIDEPAKGEIECPNSTKGIQCADCALCKGSAIKAKSIYIKGHGPWWKKGEKK